MIPEGTVVSVGRTLFLRVDSDGLLGGGGSSCTRIALSSRSVSFSDIVSDKKQKNCLYVVPVFSKFRRKTTPLWSCQLTLYISSVSWELHPSWFRSWLVFYVFSLASAFVRHRRVVIQSSYVMPRELSFFSVALTVKLALTSRLLRIYWSVIQVKYVVRGSFICWSLCPISNDNCFLVHYAPRSSQEEHILDKLVIPVSC